MSVRSTTTAGVCGPAEHSRRKQQQQPERSMARLLHLGALEQTSVNADGSSCEPDADDVDIVVKLGDEDENARVEIRDDDNHVEVIRYLLLAVSIRVNEYFQDEEDVDFDWTPEDANSSNYPDLFERLEQKLKIATFFWWRDEEEWNTVFGHGQSSDHYKLFKWNSERIYTDCYDRKVLEFSCKSATLKSFLGKKIAPGSSMSKLEQLRNVAAGGW